MTTYPLDADELYLITIYDFAWYARPDARHSNPFGLYLWSMRSDDKFQGVLTHELAHVAQQQTKGGSSDLVQLFIEMTGGDLPFRSEYGYGMSEEEAMAITVAMFHYWDTHKLTLPYQRYMGRITAPPLYLPVVLRLKL